MNPKFLTPEATAAGVKIVTEGACIGVLLHDRETSIALSPKQIAGAAIRSNGRAANYDSSIMRYSVEVEVEVRGTPEEVTRSLILQLAGQVDGLREQIMKAEAKPMPVSE
jgi:hypothetical protein